MIFCEMVRPLQSCKNALQDRMTYHLGGTGRVARAGPWRLHGNQRHDETFLNPCRAKGFTQKVITRDSSCTYSVWSVSEQRQTVHTEPSSWPRTASLELGAFWPPCPPMDQQQASGRTQVVRVPFHTAIRSTVLLPIHLHKQLCSICNASNPSRFSSPFKSITSQVFSRNRNDPSPGLRDGANKTIEGFRCADGRLVHLSQARFC